MAKRESLYHRYPDYRVDLEPNPNRVRVRLGDEVIAETERSLRVLESKHDPVLYVPREDVRLEHLERTEQETFCPFKGEASYWTVRADGRVEENAVWSYESPFEQVAGLKDYMAFYTDRLTLEELA